MFTRVERAPNADPLRDGPVREQRMSQEQVQDRVESQQRGFEALLAQVTSAIAGRPLDSELEAWLNRSFPPTAELVADITAACHEGIESGWICKYEAGGIRYGRVIKPRPELNGYSVDVVRMKDVVGPHHKHPNGEIDLVMPITPDARFDQRAAGWVVYPPNSAHRPTVSHGEALVLYLLPNGAIEFTQS
jgi:hypothetical protein